MKPGKELNTRGYVLLILSEKCLTLFNNHSLNFTTLSYSTGIIHSCFHSLGN